MASASTARRGPSLRIANRYRVLRELHRGRRSSVFVVADDRSPIRELVLKRLEARDGRAMMSFASEFRLLSDLAHPGLCRVLDMASDEEGRPFLLAEVAPGRPVSSFAGLPTRAVLRDLLTGIGRVLTYLHGQGIVHFDVKPDNIIARESGSGGLDSVKLVDFDLAAPAAAGVGRRGTPPFVAPEVISGDEGIDHRADLYSLGATAVAVILGQPQPDLPNISRIEDLLALLPETAKARYGEDLLEVIFGLLRPHPDERVASARDFLQALSHAFGGDVLPETSESRLAPVFRPRFIAREEELDRLRASFPNHTRVRPPGATETKPFVLVSGEPGVGKTRLLEQYSVSLKTIKVAAFTLTAPGGDARGVGTLVQQLADDMAWTAGETSDDRPAVVERRGEGVPGWRYADDASPRRIAVFADVARRALEIARKMPLAIHFDDVHELGELGQDFLCRFVRRVAAEVQENGSALSIQVAMSFNPGRLDWGQLSSLFAELREDDLVLGIQLGPFDRDQTAQLLAAMVAPDQPTDSAADWLHERTHGNPLFVSETVADLLVEGDRPLETEQALAIERLKAAPVASKVRALIESRVARLGADERVLLEHLALHPRSTDPKLLAQIVKLEEPRLSRAVEHLARRRLLDASALGEIGFVDADTKLVVAQTMSPERRRVIHETIAANLADAVDLGPDAWIVTYHRVHSDGTGRYWGDAYEDSQALLKGAREDEASVLLGAIVERASESSHLRYIAAVLLADILCRCGNLDRAERTLALLGEPGCTTSPPAAGVSARIAVARGLYPEACAILDRAAVSVRERDPEAAAELILSLGQTSLLQGDLVAAEQAIADASALLQRVGRLADTEVPAEESIDNVRSPSLPPPCAIGRNQATLIQLRAEFEFRRRRLSAALYLALLSVKMEGRLGNLPGLGQGLHLVGKVFLISRRHDRAARYLQRAISLQRDVGDLMSLGSTYNNLGILENQRGNSGQAIECFREALRIRREIGHRQGEVQCYKNIANTYIRRNELAAAARDLNICLKLKRKLPSDNNPAVELNSLGAVAELRDRYSSAIRYYREAMLADRTLGNDVRALSAQINVAGVLVRVGQYRDATQTVGEALRRARREGMGREVGFALAIRAESRRAARDFDAAARDLQEAVNAFAREGLVDDEISAKAALVLLELERGDINAARTVHRTIVPCSPDELRLGTSLELAEAELVLAGPQGPESTTRGLVDRVMAGLSRAEKYRMPGLRFRAAATLARHFFGLGEEDRTFHYFSVALESLEAVLRAIGDSKMMASYAKTPNVAEFQRTLKSFIQQHCPEIEDEDRRLPRDVRRTITGMKRGLFDVERALGTTEAQLRRNEEGIRRILEISQTLSSTAPVDELLEQVVDGVIDFSGAERGFVILTDPKGGVEIPVARTTYREAIPNPETQVSARVVESLRQTRRPVLLQNAMDEEGYRARESVLNLELRSIMCAPLIRQDQLLGMVYVDNRSQIGRFQEEDLELLNIFASQAAIALENSRLVTEFVRDERMRTMGTLAASVAHDFNNLLAEVLGRTQLLRDTTSDPAFLEHLVVIEKAARDGAVVARRLQNTNRESRRREFELVDLREIVGDVIGLTRSKRQEEAFQDRRVDVENVVEAGAFVFGSPSELRSVFTNIMLNAIAALTRGGRVKFESVCTDDRVRIIVRDSGVGMSESIRASVFQPFFTTKGREGTGLGMTTAYGILTQHGGQVHVESREGEGTAVVVDLPRRRATDDIGPKPTPKPVPGRGERILVVDDEAGIRELLYEILTRAGYDVVIAASGAEALNLFGRSGCDLVLTDLGMLPMSGWDLAREVKERDPDMPVVVLTGWAGEVESTLGDERWVDLLVAKPFDLADLLSKVGEALRGSTSKP